MSEALPFAKGHGTGNDFVLLPDADGSRYGSRVDPDLVSRLCDRRRGIGGDGVIRVVRSGAPGVPEAPGAGWFMDYLNADGSIAEMCGNGIRVFVRHLIDAGLVAADSTVVPVGTRAGVLHVRPHGDSDLVVTMGPVRPGLSGRPVEVLHPAAAGRTATAVAVPNPHVVVAVDDLAAVGELVEAPRVRPEVLFPHGANIEFVVREAPTHLRMRVWERGVGETLSCGTGVCAAAWVAMTEDGATPGTTYTVDVPGGRLWVTSDDVGSLQLRGPAVLVAEGTLDPSLLILR